MTYDRIYQNCQSRLPFKWSSGKLYSNWGHQESLERIHLSRHLNDEKEAREEHFRNEENIKGKNVKMGTLISVPGFLRKAVTSTMNSISPNTDKQKCLPFTFHTTSLS